jgi:hypothetical protein
MSGGLLHAMSTDDLKKRRGELAYGAQMMALEGLAADDGDRSEAAAIDEELKRRGVDLHAG